MGAFLSLLADLGKEMGKDMLSEASGGMYKPGDPNEAGGGKSMGTKIGDFLSSDKGPVPSAPGSTPAGPTNAGAPPGPAAVPAAPGPGVTPTPPPGSPGSPAAVPTTAAGAMPPPGSANAPVASQADPLLEELKKRQLGVLQDPNAPVPAI